jgi:hypothetical protein
MLIESQSGRIILEILVATAILGLSTIGIISGIALSYNRISSAFSSLKSESHQTVSPHNSTCVASELTSGFAGIRCESAANNYAIFVR